MTSRERVRAVLEHRRPDRIPNGLGSCETGGLHIVAYETLKTLLGITDSPTRLDTCMMNAVIEPEVLQAVHGDIILLGSPSLNPTKDFWTDPTLSQWKKAVLWGREIRVARGEKDFIPDGKGGVCWGEHYCPPGSYYFDPPASNSLGSLAEVDYPRAADYHPPQELPHAMLMDLERNARFLYENTEYAISCGETITDLQVMPCPQDVWWTMMLDEPEEVKEFLGKALEAGLKQLRQLDQAIGKYTDILCIAHDLGDSRGITMGPSLFREIYKPFYKELFTAWHRITRMKSNLHSCGAVSEILPDLIECGVDILNPVQLSAAGMEPERITRLAGGDLIFFGGGLDSILCAGDDYEACYRRVKNTLSVFKAYERYIFAGVHNLTAEIPPHVLRAMLDAYTDVMDY